MSETEGGQTDEVGRRRHREQAGDIMTNRRRRGQADNVTDKQTHRRGISTRLRVSTVKKDLDCKVQMTQFELLCQQTATNERTIEPTLDK
jgi:hypothetical protein